MLKGRKIMSGKAAAITAAGVKAQSGSYRQANTTCQQTITAAAVKSLPHLTN